MRRLDRRVRAGGAHGDAHIGLRQGMDHIPHFNRANFDSLLGRFFQPITNYYDLVGVTNSTAQVQHLYRVVTFPDLSLADMQSLVSTPASRAASGATSEPLPNSPWMVSGEAEKAAETDVFAAVEAENKAFLARQMLLDGRSQREIIAEIWGATGGRAYQQAADELRQIIQELVK